MIPIKSRQSSAQSRSGSTKQASPSRFPTLTTLLRGYLHEGYLAEHGSVDSAVQAFCKAASPAQRRKIVAEWRMLSVNTATWTVAEIGHLLTHDFGGAWVPSSKHELARIFDIVKAAGQ